MSEEKQPKARPQKAIKPYIAFSLCSEGSWQPLGFSKGVVASLDLYSGTIETGRWALNYREAIITVQARNHKENPGFRLVKRSDGSYKMGFKEDVMADRLWEGRGRS